MRRYNSSDIWLCFRFVLRASSVTYLNIDCYYVPERHGILCQLSTSPTGDTSDMLRVNTCGMFFTGGMALLHRSRWNAQHHSCSAVM